MSALEETPIGAIRVTAKAATRARAGFRFGPAPTVLGPNMVSPTALLALIEDPQLVVEITSDGEAFMSVRADELAGLRVLADATRGMSHDEIEIARSVGRLDIGDVIRRSNLAALAAGSIAEPGKGAGADHPSPAGRVVVQPDVDPNPPLSGAGVAGDAALPITRDLDAEAAVVDRVADGNQVTDAIPARAVGDGTGTVVETEATVDRPVTPLPAADAVPVPVAPALTDPIPVAAPAKVSRPRGK